MASLPSGPDSRAGLERVLEELQGLRRSVDAMEQRLGVLTQENAVLRQRLELGDTARKDLLAQTEHVLSLLADSRREVRDLAAKLELAKSAPSRGN